jgi:hypothetical protein
VAKRGTNTALARWTGAHYSDLLREQQNSSRFVDVNRILVGCGDASVFAQLLDGFWSLADNVRHFLSYAVVERGEPWVSAFQKVAFAADQALPDVYQLYETVSGNIDDETARSWIANGPETLGWRVLVRRHGNNILPELLAALPSSFSGLNVIPALRAISELADPPDDLTDEIWKRTTGTLTPIATEDIIRALACVRRTGIPSLIAFQRQNVHWLPNLGFNRFLLEYYKWERATGMSVRVKDATGTRDFGEWIRLVRWPKDSSDRLAEHYLLNAELPVSDDVLSGWASGERSLRRFVRISGPLRRYHAGAVLALLQSEDGLPDLLKIFSTALDLFPEEVLLQVLAKAKSIQEFHSVLSAVAASNSAANRRFHAALVARLLHEPNIDSHGSRQLARVLAVHSRSALRSILGDGPHEEVKLWLIRDVEEIARVRLVNEAGQWLS